MKVFIDCEFNSYQGELISMALVAEDGREMYCRLPIDSDGIHPWVAEHVLPVMSVGSAPECVEHSDLPYSIESFLSPYDRVHLVADYPDDARFFCEYLITGPGERVDTPPLTIEIIRDDADSEVPHNALHDARGIRAMVMEGASTLSMHEQAAAEPQPTNPAETGNGRAGQRAQG